MNNMSLRDLCIILGMDKNYTGAGEKIVIVEDSLVPGASGKQHLLNLGVKIPYNIKEPDANDSLAYHSVVTAGALKETLPDAEVYLIPRTPSLYNFLYENSVDTISASLTSLVLTQNIIDLISEDTFFLASAGNDAENYEEELAMSKYVTAVGAAYLQNPFAAEPLLTARMESFSSEGYGKVHSVGLDRWNYLSLIHPSLLGTSFSILTNVVLSSEFNSQYKKKFGVSAPPKTRNYEMKLRSLDLLEPGKDYKSGYGLYNHKFTNIDIMPQFDDILWLKGTVHYDKASNIVVVRKDILHPVYSIKEISFLAFIIRSKVRELPFKAFESNTLKVVAPQFPAPIQQRLNRLVNTHDSHMDAAYSLMTKKIESGKLITLI